MFGTATADRQVFKSAPIGVSRFGKEPKTEMTARGTMMVRGLRIFRVGTFTDMYGQTFDWEDTHLDEMVGHFALLRNGGVFPDVPVREDHRMSMASVIGYFENLYRSPEDNQFLEADIELTEQSAIDKYNRRTYRSRSIEIGPYLTNSDSMYFPVVMGVAFVDIPAVEGLHSRSTPSVNGKNCFSYMIVESKETDVDINDPRWPDAARYAQAEADWQKALSSKNWTQAGALAEGLGVWAKGVTWASYETHWLASVTYAQGLEDEAKRQGQPTPTAPPAPAPHGAPPAQGYSFRVNGQPVSDFAQVQAHIDTLEQTINENVAAARTSFVTQLAKDNKITATQVVSLSALVQTMTDHQYETFRASYANAPSLQVLAPTGQGFTGFGQEGPAAPVPTPAGQPSNGGDIKLSRQQQLEEIVKNHRRTGISQEDLHNMASFKELAQIVGGADKIKL